MCLASFLTFIKFFAAPGLCDRAWTFLSSRGRGGASLVAWASYLSGFSCLRVQNVPQLSQHALPRDSGSQRQREILIS